MKKWLLNNKKHLIILSCLLIFALTANPLYVLFILRNGKPVAANIALPPVSKALVYELNELLPTRLQGEDLYELRGFAFYNDDPEAATIIQVVLLAPDGNLLFPTHPVQFPNMIESYPNYTTAMNRAEFQLLLSPNAMKPGEYVIGLLLHKQGNPTPTLVLTGSEVIRTHNTLKYVPPS